VVISAPFNIREYNFTLKPEKRSVSVAGAVIAAASGEDSAWAPLVDGRGLGNSDADRLLEHTTAQEGMWVSDTANIKDGIVFDLPGDGKMLESIAVWNYNKPAYTDLGIQKADISVWTAKDGWKTILKDATLEEAEGSDDYDEPTLLTFKPVAAEKVRFENLKAFNPEMKQLGLSEVCFYEPLGPAACNPEPADNAQVQCVDVVELVWMAGKGAIAHDVYVGENQDSLTLLGRVKGAPQVKVSGLSAGQKYAWRVDEVAKDGAVQKGPLWSLTLRDPLIAHWKLDETEGPAVLDASGKNHNGSVFGNPDWRPSDMGGVLSFDGSSYVDVGDLQLAEPVSALTLAAWFKVDVFDKDCQAIVTKGDASWRLSRDGQTSALHFACNGLEKWYLTGKTPVDDGQWHHAAAVYDGTRMSLYVDGRLDASESVTGRLRQDDQPVRIGANSQMADRLWKGMIDDVRIYEYALNADQVQQLSRRQAVAIQAGDKLQLVDADWVEAGESLEAIAAAEIPAVRSNKNWIAVGLIVLVIVGFAAVSIRGKKK
jgi:hypothetical protein